jgi:phosphate transport system substrate-binding protein
MKKLFLAAAVLLATAASAQTLQINGAGATFPYPIYSKWFDQYHKTHPNAEINYQSIGSGGGIRQLSAGTVFFGASDGPMTNDQIAAAGFRILHLPMVLGGDVPVYNITGVSAELRFTGPLLADIFLGKITRWNDPAIRAVNPGVSLPGDDITVVHRSDGSGTTYIWVDYLSKVSPEWKQKVGVSTSVNWPTGVGGKGNEGVAGLVKQTPGSIGYVELIYAIQNKISYGSVQNQAGEFLRATTETVSNAAAAASKNMPKDFRVSITNAPGHDVYPISSFTWLLLQEAPKDVARSRMMVEFVRWALTDGQQYAPQLGYAPLPKEVVAMEMEALKRVRQ